jgi:hypothetical protein
MGKSLPKIDTRYYHITRREVKNLPREGEQSSDVAEVVLAFPTTSNGVPVLEPQDVYAYQPIHDFGFSVGPADYNAA